MNDRDIEDTRQPPDEPEAEYCDECGDELEILDEFDGQKYTKCVNDFCPKKHEGITKEMAEKIVELLSDNHKLSARVKYLEWREKNLIDHIKDKNAQ